MINQVFHAECDKCGKVTKETSYSKAELIVGLMTCGWKFPLGGSFAAGCLCPKCAKEELLKLLANAEKEDE